MAVSLLLRRIVQAYRGRGGEQAWARFFDDPAPELADLQALLGQICDDALSPDELSLIERIERRRAELRTCDSEILYRDFGAGLTGEVRTEHQLLEGSASRRRVADLALASVPRLGGLLLLRLIRRFRPQGLLELGSALGISASYQVAALTLNEGGHLHTLEGCPGMAEWARQSIAAIDPTRATVVEGRFQDTLPGVLERVGQVGFAFIDGHHDREATVGYWRQIVPRLRVRSVVVFDDIDWSEGMARAWKRIARDPAVSCSIDMGKFGFCLCLDERFEQPRCFKLALEGG